MHWLLACLALTASCTVADEEVVDLADLSINRLILGVQATQFLGQLGDQYPYNTCPVLDPDRVTATLGGEPLVIHPGEFTGRMDGYPDCNAPSVSIDHLPAVSPATLEIRDPTRTITCALDAALVKRAATLVPDGPWTMSVGRSVTVRWPSVAEVAAGEMVVTIGGVSVSVSSNADLLTFTVPTLAPGSHEMSIVRRGMFYRTVDCGGIDNMLLEDAGRATFVVEVDIQ